MIFFQTKSIATESSSVKFKFFMIFEMYLNIFRVKNMRNWKICIDGWELSNNSSRIFRLLHFWSKIYAYDLSIFAHVVNQAFVLSCYCSIDLLDVLQPLQLLPKATEHLLCNGWHIRMLLVIMAIHQGKLFLFSQLEADASNDPISRY